MPLSHRSPLNTQSIGVPALHTTPEPFDSGLGVGVHQLGLQDPLNLIRWILVFGTPEEFCVLTADQ